MKCVLARVSLRAHQRGTNITPYACVRFLEDYTSFTITSWKQKGRALGGGSLGKTGVTIWNGSCSQLVYECFDLSVRLERHNRNSGLFNKTLNKQYSTYLGFRTFHQPPWFRWQLEQLSVWNGLCSSQVSQQSQLRTVFNTGLHLNAFIER